MVKYHITLIISIIFITILCGCISHDKLTEKDAETASNSAVSMNDGFRPLLSQIEGTEAWGISIRQTVDNGYVVCGDAYDGKWSNFIFMLKIDSSGRMIWAKKFSEGDVLDNGEWKSYDFYTSSLQQNQDGSYTIYAWKGFGGEDGRLLIINMDKNGNPIEKKVVLDMPDLISLAATKDGGFILSGVDKTDSYPNYSVLLIKIDSDSNIEWTKTFKASGDAYGESVMQTSDNGYIIKCSISNKEYDSKGWLIKTDSNGNKLWDRIFWSGNHSSLYDVVQTLDQDLLISGGDCQSIHLAKINENGNLIWERTFFEGLVGSFDSIQGTSDDGYIIAGQVSNCPRCSTCQGTSPDAVVIKIDSRGKKIWQKVFGGIGHNSAEDIMPTSDGGYVITGATTKNSSTDLLLIKIDSMGNEEWGYYHHPL